MKIMKTKILKLIVILLLAGMVSCGKDDEETYIPPADPKEAVLGKWELVAIGDETYKPTGYVEYLSDSIIAWYDYATKKQEILLGKYWFDAVPYSDIPYPNTTWVLCHQEIRNDDLSMYEYYKDKPYGNNFECSFTSNKMSLYCLDLLSIIAMPKYIYKRKK
jgi:hypothetical protein